MVTFGLGGQAGKACPAERPSPSAQAGTRVLSKAGSGDACRASAILARAQRREVRPNIWASRRSESGSPAGTLSWYAATACSLANFKIRRLTKRHGPLTAGISRGAQMLVSV